MWLPFGVAAICIQRRIFANPRDAKLAGQYFPIRNMATNASKYNSQPKHLQILIIFHIIFCFGIIFSQLLIVPIAKLLTFTDPVISPPPPFFMPSANHVSHVTEITFFFLSL
jgi:hypothetical protein